MFKKIFIFFCFIIIFFSFDASSQDAKELYDTAKILMHQGNYESATSLYLKALQQDSSNLEISRDLALNYYYLNENGKALETIKPVLENYTIDDQAYQIAGNIYRALEQWKESEVIYKKGLKKFPKSGPLYNQYGELLASQQIASAINQWERGIEADPNYPDNYYNAAKYYASSDDKVWSVIYPEIFLNIEPQSGRTAEVKNILLDGYRKLFADPDALKSSKGRNNFEQAFLQIMARQSDIAAAGINAETLTMIRTRFILNWFERNAAKYPFKLFDFHQQLLQKGIFDAYNQWLFTAAQNLGAYQAWTTAHAAEYNDFADYQRSKSFNVPSGQYYHK